MHKDLTKITQRMKELSSEQIDIKDTSDLKVICSLNGNSVMLKVTIDAIELYDFVGGKPQFFCKYGSTSTQDEINEVAIDAVRRL